MVTETTPALLGTYSSSWAFIVGINRYDNYRHLKCAVHDADAFGTMLVKSLGFPPHQVRAILDPAPREKREFDLVATQGTRTELETLFFSGLEGIDRDARLVIFFAGHGLSRAPSRGRPIGYLLPSNAEPDRIQTMLGMDRLTSELNRAVAAKHALFVLDCCYSGLAATRGSESPPIFTEAMLKRWGRQVLTAGTSEQVVQDEFRDGHSLFTYALLEGLAGSADLKADGVITATELLAFVAGQVQERGSGFQLPELYPLDGHEQGADFVFQVDPIEFDAAAIPTIILDGQRRPFPRPRFSFLGQSSLALSSARAEVEASLRELGLLAGVEDYLAGLDDLAVALERIEALPVTSAGKLVDFIRLLEKAAFRPFEPRISGRMLAAAETVVFDLEELKARRRTTATATGRGSQPAGGQADESLATVDAALESAIRSSGRLDDYGVPILALGRVGESSDWVDLVVGVDLQPLVLPTAIQANAQWTRYGIAYTPPGVTPGWRLAMPLTEANAPVLSFVAVVTGLEEIRLAAPIDQPPPKVSFPAALQAVITRARTQDNTIRARHTRAATGALVRVLVGFDGRPVRFWVPSGQLPELVDKPGLACLVLDKRGISAVLVDESLSPVREPSLDQTTPTSPTQP